MLFCNFAYGEAGSLCKLKIETFSPVFLESLNNHYIPLLCPDNVLKVALSVKHSELNLTHPQVILVRHKWAPHFPILPLKPKLTHKDRTYLPQAWMFHVFLFVDGLVFDMDYTDEPIAIGIKSYMEQMWRVEDKENLVVQIKPLSNYSAEDTRGELKSAVTMTIQEFESWFLGFNCSLDLSTPLMPKNLF